jgi:hypothetical protein
LTLPDLCATYSSMTTILTSPIVTDFGNSSHQFISSLSLAINGLELKEISKENKPDTIQNCLDSYHNFIIEYFKANFQIQDAKILEDSIAKNDKQGLSNISDFQTKFDQAYIAFLGFLSQS